MEYTVTQLPHSEIEIHAIIPFSEFEDEVKRAAKLISEEKEFAGFRKGRAPYEIIKNNLGEMAVYERGAELAVKKTYPSILQELLEKNELLREHPPIGEPEITITKLAPQNELRYKVKLYHLPQITLPDYKNTARSVLKKEKKPITVTDEEVKKTIEDLRELRREFKTVERPAQKNDRLEIDFEIRSGGVKLGGGESRNHPLFIGEGKFLPGFEEKLIGMKAGEEKFFTLVVPDDWHEKNLAGKALDIKVSVKLVQEKILPELNDDFAKSLGSFSSLQNLTESIKEGLQKEREQREKERIRIMIAEKIAADCNIDLPQLLVERELEKMVEELKSGIAQMGMKWEEYLTNIKKTAEDLKQEWEAAARTRTAVALVLREIAQKEKIEVAGQEVEERVNRFLQRFSSAAEAEKNIDPRELREYTKGVLRNEKVFELLESVKL